VKAQEPLAFITCQPPGSRYTARPSMFPQRQWSVGVQAHRGQTRPYDHPPTVAAATYRVAGPPSLDYSENFREQAGAAGRSRRSFIRQKRWNCGDIFPEYYVTAIFA